jgi:hypothetical protein
VEKAKSTKMQNINPVRAPFGFPLDIPRLGELRNALQRS